MTNEEATLVPETQERLQATPGPKGWATITPVPSQAPAQPPAPTRRTRSDKGVPKKPPADPDEITLKLTFAQARAVASGAIGEGLSIMIQDQIIGCLQKRLDQLSKQK